MAFNLARLVEDRGIVADAERRYRDLLVASPKMTECLLRLASMRAERRDFAAATACHRPFFVNILSKSTSFGSVLPCRKYASLTSVALTASASADAPSPSKPPHP